MGSCEEMSVASAMPLKTKILLLAVIPLLASVLAIACTVISQERRLAQRERLLIESAYMRSKEVELRHYVDLALSTIRPLYASQNNDAAARDEAMRLLASMDYGPDGYFFLYDLDGNSLM